MFSAGAALAAHDLRPFDAASLEAIRLEHAGRPFVLALWSVHCEPCAREMALWRRLHRKHPGVEVILVATDHPGERAKVAAFLRRHDPGPVQRWAYADEFEERIRYSIDPAWRGELPRAYFFDAAHKAEARSGVVDERWAERWFERSVSSRLR
jgi:hypothetical protein